MQKIFILFTLFLGFQSFVAAQKLEEPHLLGVWIAGEDPSEFLLHRVMEYSEALLKDNPEGKLLIRICSSDNFSAAFIKSPLNPLAASNYNRFGRIIVPYEKIYIANSSRCHRQSKFIVNEYWFTHDTNTLEYEEIYSVKNIYNKTFTVDDYDFNPNKRRNTTAEKKQFESNVNDFVNELKANPKAEGFIVHNSKNKTMNRNIEKVTLFLQKEKINLRRVKTVVNVLLSSIEDEKLLPIKDEKRYFPDLKILAVEK